MSREKKATEPDAALTFDALEERIRVAYCNDKRPWVIGYSGGKDSTCALQMIWRALQALPKSEREKPIYVLSSDTLVETPVIVDYIDSALTRINDAAKAQGMPVSAHKVVPDVNDSFWVNLIGRGYPAPSRRFRWCTERLKIDPANAFIKSRVAEFGEVVMVLGVRSAESATRAQVMALHRLEGSLFSRHSSLLGAYVFTPIEALSVDDVWDYILQTPSPWGADNRQLLKMYRNAQAGECPLVVDKNTESCGNSRFGCWVCTVVTKDKAMEAMVDNGEEWLEPLLDVRDFLAETLDPERKKVVRDFRRRTGKITLNRSGDGLIPGPYKRDFRQEVLKRLLEAQREAANLVTDEPAPTLIHEAEIHEIQRIWRRELGDWANSAYQIVKDVLGKELHAHEADDFEFSSADGDILRQVCQEHDLPIQMMGELLDAERSVQGMRRRSSIHTRIASILEKEWRSEDEVLANLAAELEEEGAANEAPNL
ncbi:DNA phosphorothioation system sulfurtransferase DndC [uncultured Roseobacter sp.]|uniref:DNA phosphorothioation system sulfurtransferase DndC n=1 Tax=uncultured Roseobacter sp. TaxID=114847 RepID=UPI00262A1053|nr:DNA phosphorothioation system sulfurtransferase DndC [uncultured Roseobacter sp.]